MTIDLVESRTQSAPGMQITFALLGGDVGVTPVSDYLVEGSSFKKYLWSVRRRTPFTQATQTEPSGSADHFET